MPNVQPFTIMTILEVEELLRKPVSEFNMEEIQFLFQELRCYKPSGFRVRKHEVLVYIQDKYGTCSAYPLIQSLSFKDIDTGDTYNLRYFKNFQKLSDSVWTRIDLITSFKEQYYTTAACIYLAWSGVKLKEALELKKRDLYQPKNLIMSDALDLFVRVEPQVMDFLIEYSNATSFPKEGNHGWIGEMYYEPSLYLLRSSRSHKLSESSIRRYMNRLNFGERKFRYECIYWSGKFDKLHQKEVELGCLPRLKKQNTPQEVLDFYSDILGKEFSTTTMITKKLREYLAFKNYFYTSE